MEIYPAVDLYEGNVVRLEQGDYARCKVYSTDPVEIAKKWAGAGTRWLHIVDLDGAKTGKIQNWESLKRVQTSLKVSIQFGGGVRTFEDVQRLIELGIKRVILGSKALDPDFLKKVTETFKNSIALSLDLKGDAVQIEGWLKSSGKSVYELFENLSEFSIDAFIITDIERDGTLKGPNLDKIENLLKKSPKPVILSGGVSSLEDVRSIHKLKNSRLDGMIIGKALYEGKIELKEAFKILREERN